ncbi:DUF6274 family protein [Streptomyces sp. NPDC048428]|uniref:DUF6274 family protein n=1 Tax=Streptomyces sp. NPDC048428 TaxID=3154503 RepID=UPI00341AE833
MAVSTGEGLQPDRSGPREPAGAFVAPVRVPGPAPAPIRRRTPRHEIRALLRAHLAAASGYRHLTRHCAVCARLLRLAMEPTAAPGPPERAAEPTAAPEALEQTARPVKTPGRQEQTAGPVTASTRLGRAVGPVTTTTRPGAAMGPSIAPGAPEQTAGPASASTRSGRATERSGRTAEPVAGPGAPHKATEPSDAALASRSERRQMPARHAPAPASAPPGGAEMGFGDRRDPTWAQDESPPAT